MKDILENIQSEMKFAQAVMTTNTNKKQIPAPYFKPGNKVWLSTHNLKTR